MLCNPTMRGLAACFLSLLATAASAQSQLQANKVMQIAGMTAPGEARENPVAAPAPTHTLHLTFALTFERRAELHALIARQQDPKSPDFHRWLTPQQIGQRFGATDADLQAVVNYAKAQGFHVTNIWPNRLFISADASVTQAERAFQLHIRGYDRPPNRMHKDDPPTFFAPDREPQVPAALAARLQGIYGMSSLLRMHALSQAGVPLHGSRPWNGEASLPLPQSLTPPPGTPGPHPMGLPFTPNGIGLAYGPAQISAFYDFDALHSTGLNGDGMWIGLFSPTLADLNDLAFFTASYGIAGFQLFDVLVDGGPTDFNGQDEENLDEDVILGQCLHCNLVRYKSPNGGNALDPWLAMQADDFPVISSSWGFDESDLIGFPDFVNAFDSILAAMAAQGQAIYNASGDDGAFNRAHTALSVVFPASDPNVTATGGTSLPGAAAWSAQQGWSGSGGGLSRFFSLPSYQNGPGVPNGFSNGMRQVPDIAALADPIDCYWVFTRGQWLEIGGTSAAAPLLAAANLLIDQGAGVSFGNLNPALYWMGTYLNDTTDIFVFHDSTSGNNGYFSCTPYWDYLTGWGTPNVYKLWVDLMMTYNVGHPELRPDLLPYNPGSGAPGGNWTSSVMIHTAASNVAEPAAFNDTDTYYFAASVLDNAPADAVANLQSIRIDGVDHTYTAGAFPAGYYYYQLQAYSTRLTAGTHTIQLIADINNVVSESNEGNNVFTRTITVNHASTLVDTSMTVADVTGQIGQTVTLSAVLRRTDTNTVLASRTVQFYVGGVYLGTASTNSNGVANFSYKVPDSFLPGPQTIKVVRLANSQFNGSTGTGTLTVTAADTSVTVANASGDIGQTVTLSAVLRRTSDNTVLSGRTLYFYVGSGYVGSAAADSNGKASFSYKVSDGFLPGPQTIKVVRLANNQYNGSTGTGTLTVTAANTSITVANVSGQAGQTVSLSAVLRRTSDNTVLPGRTLLFYVAGAYIGSGSCDSTGTAHMNYTIPANLNAGKQLTIKVVRLANSQYNGSADTGTLTVTP